MWKPWWAFSELMGYPTDKLTTAAKNPEYTLPLRVSSQIIMSLFITVKLTFLLPSSRNEIVVQLWQKHTIAVMLTKLFSLWIDLNKCCNNTQHCPIPLSVALFCGEIILTALLFVFFFWLEHRVLCEDVILLKDVAMFANSLCERMTTDHVRQQASLPVTLRCFTRLISESH